MSTKPPDSSFGAGRRFYIVDEDQLRDLILQWSPDVRRDTERMGDLIRELVALERTKRGWDQPRGALELSPNKDQQHSIDPDLVGQGFVAGRAYRAAGWLTKSGLLKISLIPPKKTHGPME